jgi:two-component system, NtrC family, sensor kinase
MRITLKTKIWFTILAIVLMFSFFSLYYFPSQQEKIMKKNFDNEAQNLANTIALGVKIALTEENFEGMRTAMSFVKDDPRLIFVNLHAIDTNWSTYRTSYKLKDTILTTFPEDTNHIRQLASHFRKDTIIKVSGFTTATMTGAIELSFTTDSIVRGKKQIRSTSLIVSGVVFIIGIIIGFWLSRNITVPVLALRDAANKVGEGDLAQRVTNKSGDEIGELSRAFNKMVEDLARAREELKKANIDLANTNEALHATVEDLKAAQAQLIQAEKMASLGQLTAGIAHEINNPINFVSANIKPLKEDMADILNVIGRYEKLINEKGLEKEFFEIEQFKQDSRIDLTMKEVNDLLKGIEEGATRTSEIVKGLRNFSRLDQNVFRKANLNESLESTLILLHSSYKNRIEIEKKYGGIPEIDCFPGQVNQVFMNILSNAVQAIPAEGTIFIKTWQTGNMVKISIKDTGAGMSEEVRKKIFDPFFTTKDVGKGTGLGLSISYGIIQKHNGEIDVFSRPGEGTEFVISIPIKQQLTT